MIPVVEENAKLRLMLAIPTGAPIILANEAIETPPLKQPNPCQNSQRHQYIY